MWSIFPVRRTEQTVDIDSRNTLQAQHDCGSCDEPIDVRRLRLIGHHAAQCGKVIDIQLVGTAGTIGIDLP